jgi:Helix-turn-helix of DDE superfamily endonuclease
MGWSRSDRVAARLRRDPYLVNEAAGQDPLLSVGASTLFHRAALPLSRKTLTFVARLIRRHRARIGSLWRKLNPRQQALLVLIHLRKGETFAGLAARFGIGTATA